MNRESKLYQSISPLFQRVQIFKEYFGDAIIFSKNYMLSRQKLSKYEYQMMIYVHSLEKGMCMDNSRPFGQKKVEFLLSLMKKAEKSGSPTTGYYMALGMIDRWLCFFEEHQWTDDLSYINVKKHFNEINHDGFARVGCKHVTSQDVLKLAKGDFVSLCESRNAARKFQDQPLCNEDVEECIHLAALAPSACNRQMCKIYWARSEKAVEQLRKTKLGTNGFTMDTMAYFIVTYDMTAFNFYGERSQGYFNAGLFAMNFVNGLHYKGIGSCFLQWGKPNKEEVKLKQAIGIPQNERIAGVIGAGYYIEESAIPYSYRRENDEILIEL